MLQASRNLVHFVNRDLRGAHWLNMEGSRLLHYFLASWHARACYANPNISRYDIITDTYTWKLIDWLCRDVNFEFTINEINVTLNRSFSYPFIQLRVFKIQGSESNLFTRLLPDLFARENCPSVV